MLRRAPPPTLRRPLAGLLVCALLLAQMLGLLHRVQHAGGLPLAARAETGWHASLFDTHHDASDCRLFDQLSHADAPGFVLAPMLPAPVHTAPAVAPAPTEPAPQRCVYFARGPPARA